LKEGQAKKDSHNSHIPPSNDYARKNKSLREPSGKKPGGQPGHKGHTLKMSPNPDRIEVLSPQYCNLCGGDLSGTGATLVSRRQEIDLPNIRPIYIEYQSYSKVCQCGHKQVGTFPGHITRPVQYSPQVEAVIGYLLVYQYIPFKRLKELLSHLFNLPLSEGSIDNMIKRLGEKCKGTVEAIHHAIEKGKALGSDESGLKVNGKKWWAWAWQNHIATLIIIAAGRGKKVIDRVFPSGFVNGVLTSDRWGPQLKAHARGHQLCLPHLLRELNYLAETGAGPFATQMKEVLKDAIELKRRCPVYQRGGPQVSEVEARTDKLLSMAQEQGTNRKSITFQQSLRENRAHLFTFLYEKDVMPDNNASERCIRNLKVKMKVSGQFKSGHGAYAMIRSVIDTCLKNNVAVLWALNLIAQVKLNYNAE
jgi:transposase